MRGVAHGAVAGVVEDHHDDRQLVRLRHPMAGGRVGEDHAAVADGRHHEAVGRHELGAQRRADAPAEPAGRAQREVGAGARPRAVVEPQLVLVEDDARPAPPSRRRSGSSTPARCAGRRPGDAPRALARSAAARCRAQARRLSSRGLLGLGAALQSRLERAQGRAGIGGDRQMARETSAWDSAGTPGPRRCERRARSAAAP